MKKLVLLTTIIGLFFCSCAKNTKTELTAEQKATIEKEVRDKLDKQISDMNELNFEAVSANFSKEGLISFISGDSILYSFSEFFNFANPHWLERERQNVNPLEIRVTVLTQDLVLTTQTRTWEVWKNNGDYSKSNGIGTQLWKKELGGWKIIHLHESGTVIEEKSVN